MVTDLLWPDDKIHPTDEGYSKLADVWFSGLQLADSKGWIKPPVSVSQHSSGKSSMHHKASQQTCHHRREVRALFVTNHQNGRRLVPLVESRTVWARMALLYSKRIGRRGPELALVLTERAKDM